MPTVLWSALACFAMVRFDLVRLRLQHRGDEVALLFGGKVGRRWILVDGRRR